MNAKHSRGPWEVKARGNICAPGSLLIAETRSYITSAAVESDEQQDANDMVLAAAPDLLAALKAARLNVRECHGFPEAIGRQMDEAIAKAEGES